MTNSTTSTFKKNKDITTLLFIVIFLVTIGILAVSSCSSMVDIDNPLNCLKKHFINIFIGFIAFVTAIHINYKHYKNKNFLLFIFTTILLILPIFFPEHKGAHRWIDLKVMSLQPSEIAKLVIVILMADFISRNKLYINTWEKNVYPIMYVAVFCPLTLFLQKDFGSTALIFALWTIMLILAKIDTKRILLIFLCAFLGLVAALIIQPYRRTRLITFCQPIVQKIMGNQNNETTNRLIKKNDDDSYNSDMAFAAFGSGGLFGKGAGKSETKLKFLPEKQTDYIFCIVGEEYGLFGALITVFLFFWFTKTALSIHNKCSDDFGKFLSFGIMLIITGQAIINMGMTTGVLPAKGFPLPFISYGGSSMLINSYMVGILINIARNNNKKL